METWLRQFFSWLPDGGAYYLLIGIVAYLESIVAVGLLVPGSVLCVFAGFLAFHGKGSIVSLIVFTAAGALLGDATSYVLGARSGGRILRSGFLQRKKDLVHRAELFFAAHGGKGVFIGRFLGPIRGLVPFIAGCAQMKPAPFLVWTSTSSVLWGLAYPGVGFVGGASWQRVQALSERMSLLILALAVLMILNTLFWRRAVPGLVSLGNRMLERLETFLGSPRMSGFASRHPRFWRFIGARLSRETVSGLNLTVGTFFCLLFGSLFAVVALLSRSEAPLRRLDLWAHEAIGTLRNPTTDIFFWGITEFGGMPVILILGGWLLLILVLYGRYFSAMLLMGGIAGGTWMVHLLKVFFQRPRPYPAELVYLPDSASFPSGHAFTGLFFYGFLVYLSMDAVRNGENRRYLYLAGSGMALLVAFSRVYLGLHWVSDVLGGLMLAAFWLSLLIGASEIRRRSTPGSEKGEGRRSFRLPSTVHWGLVFLGGLAALGGLYLRLAGRIEQVLK